MGPPLQKASPFRGESSPALHRIVFRGARRLGGRKGQGAPSRGPGRLHLGPRAAALRRLASKRACGRSLGPSGQFTFSRPTQKRLPPSRGKVRTPRLGGRALQGRTIRRGAQCAPAGGHTGPPLRILTDGADGRKHLTRHGLRPCHLPPTGGKAKGRRRRRPLQIPAWEGRAHNVRPYTPRRGPKK